MLSRSAVLLGALSLPQVVAADESERPDRPHEVPVVVDDREMPPLPALREDRVHEAGRESETTVAPRSSP